VHRAAALKTLCIAPRRRAKNALHYPQFFSTAGTSRPDPRCPGRTRLALNFVVILDNGGRPRNPPLLRSGGRGSASCEVAMRLAMLSTFGLLVALAGCSISGECRKKGYAAGSSAYQTCVSTIMQRQNEISNFQIHRDDGDGG
jgi:hypothetical protein